MTLILNGQEMATIDQYQEKRYFLKRYGEFLRESEFCSNGFYCNTCFREDHKLVKGYTRYDSLVQCYKHHFQAEEILTKITDAIYKGTKGNVKVITDLGL